MELSFVFSESFSFRLITLNWISLPFVLSDLVSWLCSPLRRLAIAQTVLESERPNACVCGVLCPWPPGVLGEALLWVLFLGCQLPWA